MVIKTNKNKKTISVTHDFAGEYIERVKLIASRDIWLDLLTVEPYTFQSISPLLSRPSKEKVKNLQRYSREWPDNFDEDVFLCVWAANSENPGFRANIKPRGRRYPDFNWHEMNEIRNMARHLFVFMSHQLKKPTDDRSIEIEKMITICRLNEKHMKNVSMAVYDVIETLTDFTFESGNEDNADLLDMFYRKHIALPGLADLQRSHKVAAGDSPYLKKIFSALNKFNS